MHPFLSRIVEGRVDPLVLYPRAFEIATQLPINTHWKPSSGDALLNPSDKTLREICSLKSIQKKTPFHRVKRFFRSILSMSLLEIVNQPYIKNFTNYPQGFRFCLEKVTFSLHRMYEFWSITFVKKNKKIVDRDICPCIFYIYLALYMLDE